MSFKELIKESLRNKTQFMGSIGAVIVIAGLSFFAYQSVQIHILFANGKIPVEPYERLNGDLIARFWHSLELVLLFFFARRASE